MAVAIVAIFSFQHRNWSSGNSAILKGLSHLFSPVSKNRSWAIPNKEFPFSTKPGKLGPSYRMTCFGVRASGKTLQVLVALCVCSGGGGVPKTRERNFKRLPCLYQNCILGANKRRKGPGGSKFSHRWNARSTVHSTVRSPPTKSDNFFFLLLVLLWEGRISGWSHILNIFSETRGEMCVKVIFNGSCKGIE